jgi:hypothetical protein
MPTIARRPAAQQERDQLQARRLQAAELFAAGVLVCLGRCLHQVPA